MGLPEVSLILNWLAVKLIVSVSKSIPTFPTLSFISFYNIDKIAYDSKLTVTNRESTILFNESRSVTIK